MTRLQSVHGAGHVRRAPARPHAFGYGDRYRVPPAVQVHGLRPQRACPGVPGLVRDIHGALHDMARAADHPRPRGGGTDGDGEHVLTAPVERVRWHAVAPVRRPLAAVPGWEVSSLADPHAVHERLVDIVDLPELEV